MKKYFISYAYIMPHSEICQFGNAEYDAPYYMNFEDIRNAEKELEEELKAEHVVIKNFILIK